MPNWLYLVVGSRNGACGSTYYAQGLSPLQIPFSGYDTIQIVRMGFEAGHENVKQLLPWFLKFQRAYKKRYKAIHNLRWIRQRELDGKSKTFPLRNFLE